MKKLLFAIALLLFAGRTVYAETAIIEMDYFYDDDGNEVEKNIDGDVSRFMSITINGEKAYCIEVGKSLYMETPHTTDISLLEYLQDKIGETKANQVYKKLNEYLYFGYGYNNQTGYFHFFTT